jgi:NAD+ kinase
VAARRGGAMRFGIYTNPEKDYKLDATKRVVRILEDAGCDICYDEDTARILGLETFIDARHCDVLLILGGDGTILRALHKYVQYGILFAGINFGRLGFMSEIGIADVKEFVARIEAGDYVPDKRMMLEAFVPSVREKLAALNEFAVVRKSRMKMIQLELYVNDTLAENYNGDGLVIATPTGSTAYSLSAGGPVISPNMLCILITPICPHSLYARSIVTRCTDVVKVDIVSKSSETLLSVDGQRDFELTGSDVVTIKYTERLATFIRLGSDTFFSQLKSKLAQWNTVK